MHHFAKSLVDLENATLNLSLALPEIKINANISNAVKQLDDRVTLFNKQLAQLRLIELLKQMFSHFEKEGDDLAAVAGFTAEFEVGPQYNDEGYDLRISYEGTGLRLHQSAGREADNNLQDTFSDFYAEHLEVSDFEGILEHTPSLSMSQTLVLEVANSARLMALLESNETTVAEVLAQVKVSCTSKDAYY